MTEGVLLGAIVLTSFLVVKVMETEAERMKLPTATAVVAHAERRVLRAQ